MFLCLTLPPQSVGLDRMLLALTSTVTLGSRSHRTDDLIFLFHDSESCSYHLLLWLVSWLNCCWSLPAQSFLASGLIVINDQDLCSLLDMSVFSSGTFSLMKEGVGFSVYALCLLRCSFSTSSLTD
jgi:hypothetical protein